MKQEQKGIMGYKVFDKDWKCRSNGKQYACPGIFESDHGVKLGRHGMHFCRKLTDCFIYYLFDSENRVAEVAALGQIDEDGKEICTDKLQIIRELSWQEVLDLVNTGKNCTGRNNTGNCNTGDMNAGYCNTGDLNIGDQNTGNRNVGHRNFGWCNTGDQNNGDWNTGKCNTGCNNSGNCNVGDLNAGRCNTGCNNPGNFNTGDLNAGDWNTGDCNIGNHNRGDFNTGDWNAGNRHSGYFNTQTEPCVMMFNKPSSWTDRDWQLSKAKTALDDMPTTYDIWVDKSEMTKSEKLKHRAYKTTGGFLKTIVATDEDRQAWWKTLPDVFKDSVKAMPNFDAKIFKQCTGIDVNKNTSDIKDTQEKEQKWSEEAVKAKDMSNS